MSSFAYFFVVFAFFIVSFGLGFYIIFNGRKNKSRDEPAEKKEEKEDDTNYFGYPFLAVIKTTAMVIGELVGNPQIFYENKERVVIIVILIKIFVF